MAKIEVNNFVDELCEIDPNYESEVKAIEEKYKCSISCDIEKHNSLQYTYFYEVDFGLEDNFFVEIESGINNGTQLNHEEWGIDSKETTKTVEVLKDIVLDMDYYEQGSFMAKKAQAFVLNFNILQGGTSPSVLPLLRIFMSYGPFLFTNLKIWQIL